MYVQLSRRRYGTRDQPVVSRPKQGSQRTRSICFLNSKQFPSDILGTYIVIQHWHDISLHLAIEDAVEEIDRGGKLIRLAAVHCKKRCVNLARGISQPEQAEQALEGALQSRL